MRNRVHELAKEFDVPSKWVIEKLKESGDFVRSASSTVLPAAEMRFRTTYGELLRAGVAPEDVTSVSDPASMASAPADRDRALKSTANCPRPAVGDGVGGRLERRTTWDDSPFDQAAQETWRRYGLGDNDARLAMYLLEHGVWPQDLELRVNGRRGWEWARSGEPWSLVVRELLEARQRVG